MCFLSPGNSYFIFASSALSFPYMPFWLAFEPKNLKKKSDFSLKIFLNASRPLEK